jgi:hypothetical protein
MRFSSNEERTYKRSPTEDGVRRRTVGSAGPRRYLDREEPGTGRAGHVITEPCWFLVKDLSGLPAGTPGLDGLGEVDGVPVREISTAPSSAL